MSDARQDDSGPPEAEAKPGADAPAAASSFPPAPPSPPTAKASPPPPPKASPPPNVSPPLPAAKPAKSRGAAWALSLLVLALALVGTAPYWAPSVLPLLPWAPPQPEAQTSALAARLDAAEAAQSKMAAQLAQVESEQQQQPQAPPPNYGAILQPLVGRLNALEQRTANSSAQGSSALTQSIQQMGARLDGFDAKLGKLAAAQASGDETDRALLAAVAELRAAMAGSGPFDGELQSVAALAHNDSDIAAALQPLSGAAVAGLPSAALLAVQFRTETAPAILHATAAAPNSTGDLGDRVLAEIEGLVTVRRIDASGTPSDPTEAAVRAAEASLDKGDLAGAIAALNGLRGGAADAAHPFIAAAQQRLDAERAVAGVAQKLMTRLAASAAPQPQQASP